MGTWDLFTEVLSRWGLTWTVVDMADLDAVAAAVTDRTALVWGRDAVQPDGGVLVPLESTIIGDWYYLWYRAKMDID
ncbi:MAG: cystathionine gamma-synthase [Pseudonocardiales bacterium]|nr:cystathionine gamma-synthase [Pseudonocardiales bacterium]